MREVCITHQTPLCTVKPESDCVFGTEADVWGDTEAGRFINAFYNVLEREPGKPPTPTKINKELGKDTNPRYNSPLNVLNGRMSVLRRRLLVENGFTQEEKFGRWRKQ